MAVTQEAVEQAIRVAIDSAENSLRAEVASMKQEINGDLTRLATEIAGMKKANEKVRTDTLQAVLTLREESAAATSTLKEVRELTEKYRAAGAELHDQTQTGFIEL